MKIIFISVTAIMFLYATIGAALSDSFWTSAPMIIGAITLFIAGLVKGFIELWKFFASLKKVADDTHTLVNSNMGLQLRYTAGFARRVAMLTKKPDDELAAIEAERLLEEHIARQAIVNAGDKA